MTLSSDFRLVLDVATLTGAISVALGTGATGVFASSSKDFEVLAAAGVHSGDRVWRSVLGFCVYCIFRIGDYLQLAVSVYVKKVGNFS